MPPTRAILFFAWAGFDSPERAFWRQLDHGLTRRGHRLVLATPYPPPAEPPDVDHITVPRMLDDLSPIECARLGAIDVSALGLDVDALLERDTRWNGPALLPAIADGRRRAIAAVAAFWRAVLADTQPAAVVVWNGQHVPELILHALCRRYGCPVLFVERAPIPHVLFADPSGLLTASGVAARKEWNISDPARWNAAADRVIDRLRAGNLTAWEQPASRGSNDLRRRLGVPAGRKLLLFAGQVDEDTQCFLFSPHFPSNIAAFEAFLGALRRHGDVFVLGKQHPRSATPADAYRAALERSGVHGVWCEDLSIDDALGACDRVCAVNSTVLYEALARGLPVLVLGEWLLMGREAATELAAADVLPAAVAHWLSGDGHIEQQAAWRRSLAFLLSECLYALDPSEFGNDIAGADALAARLADLARRGVGCHWPTRERARGLAATAAAPVASAPWWDPWQWERQAAERNGETTADIEARANRWREAMVMRHLVFTARAAASRGRPLMIWGAGAAGQAAASLLAAIDASPVAYIDSKLEPRGTETRDGRLICGPDVLAGSVVSSRPFVVVASIYFAEIVPRLDALGYRATADYFVFETAVLDEVTAMAMRPEVAC